MSAAPFETRAAFKSALANLPQPNAQAKLEAQNRNGQLTKPPGALGRLEDLAIWFASWQGTGRPKLDRPQVVVFAGNHGVAVRGVSAFPAEVTEQMVFNFQAGGAAINQLTNLFGASLDVQALSLDQPTADFTQGPAMSETEFLAALSTGWASVKPDTDLLIVGEMGIGNTTSAAALALAIIGGDAAHWTGRGTGVDDAGLSLKTLVVEQGLAANPGAKGNGLEALRCLGGREIVAMAGAIACARSRSIPLMLDGFIATAAAICLQAENAQALDHCIAGHLSAEGAHKDLLVHLDKEPLVSLGLRLGEASGAVVALSILQAAIACHSSMATFAEAGVSDQD